MNARIAIIAGAVGAMVLGVAWWQLGSSSEAVPTPEAAAALTPAPAPAPAPAPKIAGPAGLSQEERQERTETLAEMQRELMKTATERGQSFPLSDVESRQLDGFDASARAGSGVGARENERDRKHDEEVRRKEALLRWEALLREVALAADSGDTPVDPRNLRESLDELHEDLGDEEFDFQLYRLGEVNRVQIRIRELERSNARAGLAEGDLILSWNGQSVYRPLDVHQAAASVEPGAQVEIVYERNGQVLTGVIDGDYVGMLLVGIHVEP